MKHRILFILKRRDLPYTSDEAYGKSFSSGLYNSVRFISEMLDTLGVENEVFEAIDNNCIDGAVARFKPTHVIIEALWVVPSKMEVLSRLHPNVNWIVRLHSEVPFLSNEGIAIDWILQYLRVPKVFVAANSAATMLDLQRLVKGSSKRRILYLPNYYPLAESSKQRLCDRRDRPQYLLNVGCFGAIRPLKNNLIQAISAIHYADANKLRLAFHINADRNEQGGDNNLKNLQALFANTRHELVEHSWMPHDQFLRLLSTMDVSMCVSFTETFCIVAADSIAVGVPTVVSDQVRFGSSVLKAKPTSAGSIQRALEKALHPLFSRLAVHHGRVRLDKQSKQARKAWVDFLNS